jgi:hypothetical protein
MEVDEMRNGHRSAWRRRTQRSGVARIAIPLAIPVALGLVIGGVIAFSGSGNSDLSPAALGASASPSPSASASASASAATAPTTTLAANVNCDIIVPANPLTAKGLATPYQLTGTDGMTPAASGCQMSNAAALGAFVQATILNTQTGQLSVYNPLVITQGTTAAVAPTVPTLPTHYIATIDFGFNGTDLFQVGANANTLKNANCVNGEPGSVFGQVSFCNGAAFFNEAHQLEAQGKLVVPALGTSGKIVAAGVAGSTGQQCLVTHNFEMVDQDPSDNVTTQYLLNPATGQTAQDTTSNAGNIAGSTLLLNGSDNTLLDTFMDPTLGCTPFQAPDLGNNNQPTSSQALDELLAEHDAPKTQGLVPENDEMVLNGAGAFDPAKDNLYREQIGETPISGQTQAASSPQMYCQNMVNIQTPFLKANQTVLATGQSPVTAVGDNLLTFLANRLNMSFTNLACQDFGLTNPVTVTLNGAGAALAATFNTTPQKATAAAGAAVGNAPTMPKTGQRTGRHNHRLMDPSGM